MQAAVALLPEPIRGTIPGCCAHAVQTSLKHAFERTAAANNVLAKLKAIVKKFKKSKPVKEFFMQSQVDAGVQPKTLLQEVKSRWDSEEALFPGLSTEKCT